MFFSDKEKQIYTPAGADPAVVHYDPLRVSNRLTLGTSGQLHALISDRNAYPEAFKQRAEVEKTGIPGPSDEQMWEASVCTARAELVLPQAARHAFDLPDDTLDAVALEYLFDFLGWLEKKD